MTDILSERITFNNGVQIPKMGFGTWQMSDEQAATAVRQAIEAGYRMIDTAAFYNCEKGVGQGIKDSGIDREKLFVSTKVWPTYIHQGRTEEAYQDSLNRLGLEYLDLWLLHWPVNYIEGWKAMERIYQSDRVRAIGVSNMRIKQLLTLLDQTETIPACLQIECNPLVSNYEIRAFCTYKGIAVGAWQSLGSGLKGEAMTNDVILDLAEKYERTPAHILLRWAYQNNIITIPKTVTPSRMVENTEILGFALTDGDLERIGQIRQLPRYDTEIADVPTRIIEQVNRGVCFAEKGYGGNLTVDYYQKPKDSEG